MPAGFSVGNGSYVGWCVDYFGAIDPFVVYKPILYLSYGPLPAILQNTGFPSGAITVTSVPDLVFPIEADGRIWTASYNATAGSLGGKLGEPEKKPEPSTRGFLTRLHVTHGYPGEANAGWFWGILVDVMAFALCFWGCTGLVM